MPLYRNNGSNMAQMANQTLGNATSTLANQQKQTTTIHKKKTSFWDDLQKGASAINSIAGAANTTIGAIDKGIKLYDESQVKSAYDDIAKTFADGGYEAIQNNPDMRGYHHSVALGRFVQDRANTEKGRLEMMQKADEAADRLYADWRAQAYGVHNSWQKGDMDAYANGMVQLVDRTYIPYRLQYDGNGNFQELFRSDKAGGWTPTGRTLTGQDAYNRMMAILRGEQVAIRGAEGKTVYVNPEFNRAIARAMYATMMGNAENRTDIRKQYPLYDKNGNAAGLGYLQNPLDDYFAGPQVHAFGLGGKRLGEFDGWNNVMAAGLSPFKPQHTKLKGRGRGRGRVAAPWAYEDEGGVASGDPWFPPQR